MQPRNIQKADNRPVKFKFKYNPNVILRWTAMGYLLFTVGLGMILQSEVPAIFSPGGIIASVGLGISVSTFIAASANGMNAISDFLLSLFRRSPDKTTKKQITVEKTPKPIHRQEISNIAKIKQRQGTVKKPKKSWGTYAAELREAVSFSNVKRVGVNLLRSSMKLVVSQGIALVKKISSVDFKKAVQLNDSVQNKGKVRPVNPHRLENKTKVESSIKMSKLAETTQEISSTVKNIETESRVQETPSSTLSIVASLPLTNSSEVSSQEAAALTPPNLTLNTAIVPENKEAEKAKAKIKALKSEVRALAASKDQVTASKQQLQESLRALTLSKSAEELKSNETIEALKSTVETLQTDLVASQEKLKKSQKRFKEVKSELTQAVSALGEVKGENSQQGQRLRKLESLFQLINDPIMQTQIDPEKYVPLFEGLLTASRAIRTAETLQPYRGVLHNQPGLYTFDQHLQEVSQQLTATISNLVSTASMHVTGMH